MKKAKVSSVYEGRLRKRSSEMHSSKSARMAAKSARMAAKGRRDMFRAAKALSINPGRRTMVTRSMIVKAKADMHLSEENLCEVEVVEAKGDVTAYIKPMEVVPEQEKESLVNEVAAVKPQLDDLATVNDHPKNDVDVGQEKPVNSLATVNEQQPVVINEVAATVNQQPVVINEVATVNEQPVLHEVAAVTEQGDDGRFLTCDEWPMSLTSCDYEGVWPWFKIGYEKGWSTYLENLGGDFSAVLALPAPARDNNRDQPVWDDDPWDFKDDEDETKKP